MSTTFRNLLLTALCLLGQAQAFGACDLSSLNANSGGRTDILVVINENSPASCQVGIHYAQQRGLGPVQVALVKTPTSPHISWQQMQILRDQLVKRMLELATLRGFGTTTCGGSSPYYCQPLLDHIAQHAGIRYLVMTKGIPARARTTAQPTSVDGQLRSLLASHSELPTSSPSSDQRRSFAFGDGSGMRLVEPALDREYIIGRIDGLTVEAAKALVDRTLALEVSGIFGKAYYDSSVWGTEAGPLLRGINDSVTPESRDDFDRLMTALRDARSAQYAFPYRLLGIFDERRPECSAINSPQIYLRNAANAASGKSPPHCNAHLQLLGERVARTISRYPQPKDALLYAGYLDGQPAAPGVFGQLLNWRKNDSCTQTLCAAGDQACRLASTDALKELDTRCVGVADGFMGHNQQSYPMSYLWAWPTAWAPVSSVWQLSGNEFNNTGSGDHPTIAYPWVKTDVGEGDTHSLWFGEGAEPQLDDPGSASTCYLDRQLTAPGSCRSTGMDQRYRVEFQQLISFAGTSESPRSAANAPRDYELSFDVQLRGSTSTPITLRPSLVVHPVGGDDVVYPHNTNHERSDQGSSAFTISVQNSWQRHAVILRISPAQIDAAGWNGNYDGLGLRLISEGSLLTGALGFDNFSLKEVGKPDEELIRNSDFQRGHQALVTGDHAAAFMSRLNGVGFWGSVGHFAKGGNSFGDVLATFVYFWRGLPLGDAVWHRGEDTNGIFYGDPVYSPVKIRLNPVYTRVLNAPALRVGDTVQLRASTVNGSATVSTYTTAYCYSSVPSFYACDHNNGWINLPMSGAGGAIDQPIGTFGGQVDRGGWYIVRLSVQTSNTALQRQQSFNDYAFLYYEDKTTDFDGDGYTDRVETCMGANYAIKEQSAPLFAPTSTCLQDSDGDGVSDLLEILRGSEPHDPNSANTNAASDYDQDGISDEQELLIGANPIQYDQDIDGDGRSNLAEIAAGTDPLDPNSFRIYQIPPPVLQLMVD